MTVLYSGMDMIEAVCVTITAIAGLTALEVAAITSLTAPW